MVAFYLGSPLLSCSGCINEYKPSQKPIKAYEFNTTVTDENIKSTVIW
jgi:hypothetical protein